MTRTQCTCYITEDDTILREQEIVYCPLHALAPRMVEALRTLADGAVIRGRCIWCAHIEEPADGLHTSSCIFISVYDILDKLDGGEA